jgi:hypothetical protein
VKFISVLLLLTLVSCSEGSLPEEESRTSNQTFFANGVKLISPTIKDPQDERSYKEDEYTIRENSRLLVRLETMEENDTGVIIDDSNRMYFVITEKDLSVDTDQKVSSIKVCPLTKNWMILATWENAHPFPTSQRRWNRSGGDYREENCISPSFDVAEANPNDLYFDVSNWYIYEVRSYQRNYGFVIKSDFPLRIYGDNNYFFGPRYNWKKRK